MRNDAITGQLAQTKKGREINDLFLRKVPIKANHPTGQRGPWENNK